MARASLIQNTFNAGELSTLLLGRQDIAKYARGLRTCLNGIPLTQGAWTRRPGTVFLHQARHHDKVARLAPFQYSIEQTYVLEFGDLYVRFYTDHGILTTSTQNVTAVSKAAAAVLTYAGADSYANGDRVEIAGGDMTQIAGREFVVTNRDTGANTFELYDSDGVAVDSTAFDTYTTGATVSKIVEVTTLYTDSQVDDLRITQSADTLYIFHKDHPPRTLVRNSATSWTIADVNFQNGPWGPNNATTTTMSPDAATGTVTITASAVNGINNGAGFVSTDVGRLIRLREGTEYGWAEILTVGSTVSVTADVRGVSTFTNTNAKTNWQLGLYSDTTGWPVCGTFHEDRLFMAGAAVYPQRLDGSRTGRYNDFSPSGSTGTVADSDAVAFSINSDDVNAIKWMGSNEKGLLTGTGRGEWAVKPSALNEPITPTNISAKPLTRHGSSSVAPVFAGNAVLFLQRSGRKLRELAFVFEADGFKAPDMTLLAEHITKPSIREMAYQEQPQAIVWAARSAGVLLGFTYERDQDVVAWHRHELGGHSSDGIPVVRSVAVIPSPDDDRDELYLLVRRSIAGNHAKRYIEYMSKLWEEGDEQEDAFHLDCGLTAVNVVPSATVTGLSYLEGETLQVYADGAKHPDAVVTNGKITLNAAASVVSVGYAYPSDGQTMPSEGGSRDGTSQGKVKRANSVGFWLMDTLGMKYGPDADTLTEILQRRYGDDFGDATDLFTGVTVETLESDYDMLGQVYWRCEGPFPATVLAIMPSMKVTDG